MLVVWMGVSQLWASDRVLVWYAMLHVMACLGLTWLTTDFVRVRWDRGMLFAICLGAAFQGGLAIAQVLNKGALGLNVLGEITWTTSGGLYRGNGLSVNPNNLAGYLLIGLFACVAVLYGGMCRSKTAIVGLLALGASIVGGILATLSRSSLVAVAAAVSMTAFWWVKQHRGIGSAVALAGFVMVVIISLSVGAAQITGLQSRLSIDREFYFDDTLDVIEREFPLGAGAGNLMVVIGQLRGDVWPRKFPAHNVYLVILAELGIVGLALFLVGTVSILGHWWLHAQKLRFVWGACVFALMVTMLFDYYWWGDHRSRMLLFWVIGLCWGYTLQVSTPTPKEWPA